MFNNFLSTADLTHTELEELIDLALVFKSEREIGSTRFPTDVLRHRSIALVFFNPSLRTRASMQIAIHELGGNPIVVEPGGTSWTLEHREGVCMDDDKTEHVAEFVRVLSRYCAAIGVRTFAPLKNWDEERTDPILRGFARYATVPIINLESAMHHPCQSMADMMTIREKKGTGRKRVLLNWAWHPKPLPMAVPNSFALASAQMGHELVIACPSEYGLDAELMNQVQMVAAESGGSISLSHDIDAAFEGVDVVYTKSWGSSRYYGKPDAEARARAHLHNKWITDCEKMNRTNDAIFMHCLPVRRNVIVTDEVIDSRRSVVIDEAENRLHVQKAILSKLFG